jgi:hypothetical protein
MRYRLRTLLVLLALGPPVLAGGWFITQAIRAAMVEEDDDSFLPQYPPSWE